MSGPERVLFLGTSSIAQEIGERLASHSEDGLNVSGYIDNVGSQIKLAGGKALGQISDLQEIAADLEPGSYRGWNGEPQEPIAPEPTPATAAMTATPTADWEEQHSIRYLQIPVDVLRRRVNQWRCMC